MAGTADAWRALIEPLSGYSTFVSVKPDSMTNESAN